MRDFTLHKVITNCKGDCMSIDINFLSSQLLVRLANSIHDRGISNNEFCFRNTEVQVAEEWIKDTVRDILNKLIQ